MKFHLPSLVKFSYGERLRPPRDWGAVLVLFALLLLISLVGNIWLFARVASGDIIGGAGAPEPAFHSSSFDSAREVFKKRSAEEERYKSSYRFVDPSR